MDGVTYLYLASEGGLRMYGFSGSLMATAHRFKVIEVTSDKLVVTLYPLGSGEADTIYEFHRIK